MLHGKKFSEKWKIIVWTYLELCLTILSAALLTFQSLLPEQFYLQHGETIQLKGIYSLLTVSATNETENPETPQKGEIKLLGLLPVKTVDVQIVEHREVLVSGVPFGLKLYSEGVIVVGMTEVDSPDGNKNPAKDAGLQVGDILLSINGTKLESNAQAASLFEVSDGKEMCLRVRRGKKEWETTLCPAYSLSAQTYKAGVWIRDSTAGMGMMTFILPESGICAGLGHGVSDTDTGVLIPIANGEICQARLISVIKGKKGAPGQLTGCFEANGLNGTVLKNSDIGTYGILRTFPESGTLYEVAQKQEVHAGEAQMLTTVEDGEPQYYSVKIEKINYNGTQNFVIEVTDERLKEITGGIVQGNSGSPILQDGKLVGAVTHVFVNDPTKGYGIFAETMLNEALEWEKNEKAA